MKAKQFIATTLTVATVLGAIGIPNTETVSASPVTAGVPNVTAPVQALMPEEAVFHRDRETKALIRDMFDPSYYAAAYADLRLAYNIDDPNNLTQVQKDALWKHFWNGGIWEGRSCNANFNANVYASSYVDLQKAYGNDIIAYYIHYAKNAEAEERTITTVEAAVEAGITVHAVYSYSKGTEGVQYEWGPVLVDPVKIKQEEEAAKNPPVPSTPSDSDSTGNSGSVDENYAEGLNPYGVPYRGRCIQKDYEAWIAAGNAAEDYAPMPSLFLDSVAWTVAAGEFYADMPRADVYLALTTWNEDYLDYCRAHDNWEWETKYNEDYNEPEPVAPRQEDYLAQTDYEEDWDAWLETMPKIRDYCTDYTGPEAAL